jgi:hypothetical protein
MFSMEIELSHILGAAVLVNQPRPLQPKLGFYYAAACAIINLADWPDELSWWNMHGKCLVSGILE